MIIDKRNVLLGFCIIDLIIIALLTFDLHLLDNAITFQLLSNNKKDINYFGIKVNPNSIYDFVFYLQIILILVVIVILLILINMNWENRMRNSIAQIKIGKWCKYG